MRLCYGNWVHNEGESDMLMSQKSFSSFYRGIVFAAAVIVILVATNTVDQTEIIRSLAFSIGCDPVGDRQTTLRGRVRQSITR